MQKDLYFITNTHFALFTGVFASRSDLLQFYSNAGAAPGDSGNGYEPLILPPSQSSLPNYPGMDMFALNAVHSALGGRLVSLMTH